MAARKHTPRRLRWPGISITSVVFALVMVSLVTAFVSGIVGNTHQAQTHVGALVQSGRKLETITSTTTTPEAEATSLSQDTSELASCPVVDPKASGADQVRTLVDILIYATTHDDGFCQKRGDTRSDPVETYVDYGSGPVTIYSCSLTGYTLLVQYHSGTGDYRLEGSLRPAADGSWRFVGLPEVYNDLVDTTPSSCQPQLGTKIDQGLG